MLPPCPVCGCQPSIEPCEPWPKDAGPQPWYAGCYDLRPREHFVGVNGNNRKDAERQWRLEVEKRKS